MKFLIFNIFIIGIIIGCNFQADKNTYPSEVKKFGLESLYDESKFLVYQSNITPFNDEGVFKEDRERKVKLASCNVDLGYMEVEKDTIIFVFSFNKNNAEVDTDRSKVHHQYHTIYCVNGKIESIMVDDLAGFSYDFWKNNEYNNPFFTNYLITNKNNLDPWLRNKASKLGVFQ